MWTEENQVIDSLKMFLPRQTTNIFCLDASNSSTSNHRQDMP
jgi:hypothetical protein